MLHPSYSELIDVVNAEVAEGEEPIVRSRYSIVMATSKRARQIVSEGGDIDPKDKPLSMAVRELNEGEIQIVAGEALE